MKITRFNERFNLNETYKNTPESLVKIVLHNIKKKVENFFGTEDFANTGDEETTETTSNLDNIELASSEISLYSPLYDTYTVKFNDGIDSYTLIFILSLEEAIDKEDIEEIENITIKFKKYNYDFEISSQITKEIKIKEINSNLLTELKIELDSKDSDDEEEFKIEI